MSIHPIISEQFNGIIWRMVIDELTDALFLEIRNEEEKTVSFSGIDLSKGNILFDNFTTPERWLTGIEAAYDGVLLLHFYQTETGPAHKGLMAIEASTVQLLWSNYTYTFDHLSVNGPVVYDARIHPRIFFLADIKTGATIRIYEPSTYKDLENSIVVPELISPSVIPVNLTINHPFANLVHYLEYNNFRIVSLHALKGGHLRQTLLVFGGTDKLYEDILNDDIQKMQPESFIMHKNWLIYIKNKSELKVLTL